MTASEIKQDIERLLGFKQMVETYEEIAASRMRNVRNSVLENRFFLSEINLIYQQVKSSYKKQIDSLMTAKKGLFQKKKPAKVSFITHNGKTVYVLLSSNTGLYGSIIRRTFELFEKHYKDEPADYVVVGKHGANLVDEGGLDIKYTYFDFPDQSVDPQTFKKLIDGVVQYEKIVVFYGEFKSLISQDAAMTSISGDTLASQTSAAPVGNVKYFFEPSLEKIMQFFETEIFASIFEQSIKEYQLAKLSSRMLTLDTAVQNISARIKTTQIEATRLKHQIYNRKQLDLVSTISLWSGKK